MSKTQFIVFFLGKYPLAWPSQVRNGKEDEDPGECGPLDQASRFDTEAEAREKALKHYHAENFKVVPISIPI